MNSHTIKTNSHEELIDITHLVMEDIAASGIISGLCVVYTPHTTAAVTINENADPAVRADIITGLGILGLEKVRFTHMEGNSPAHIKSSLVGCSETVIINNGRLCLGTWQGIYLCEFDGPRMRTVHIQITGPAV